MFDRLFDFIGAIWDSLIPFAVINAYQKGVVLRLGRFHRVLEPGFHWVIPFVETVITDNVVLRTNWTADQTGLTKDDKLVSMRMVISWYISDIEKSSLHVDGVDDAVRDTYIGVIGDAIASHEFAQLNDRSFINKILRQCNKRAERYGVTVDSISIGDIVPCQAAFRLLNSN